MNIDGHLFVRYLVTAGFGLLSVFPVLAATTPAGLAGVPVSFTLPKGSKYLVTIAAVEKDHPERIVSTFVAGEPFDATVSNRFTVVWDGLDENFMPVPPGEYGLKGICSPAEVWPVDGRLHAISARWAGGPGAFLPDPRDPAAATTPVPFYGDPVNSPLIDVDTTPDGKAVLGFQYMENGRGCPLLDLSKPKGKDQFVASFPSGGAGGGPCACTDGSDVWACSFDSAPYFIYRPDMKPFGSDNAMFRRGGYLPKGIVTDMAAKKVGDRTFVYVVERGSLETCKMPWGNWWKESENGRVDVITVMAGENGKILAKVPVAQKPTAVKVCGDSLFVLYRPDGQRAAIGEMKLRDGIPQAVRKVLTLPGDLEVHDFARDTKGNFFVADPKRNVLVRLDASGNATGKAGRLARQASGGYDPESLMAPRRLATWRDAQGVERVLVVEQDGPNRISEWNAATLAYMGEYPNFQLKANCGYAIDPECPSDIYIPGHNDWLCRFKVDYATGAWKLDAVFDGVPDGAKTGLAKPKAYRLKGRLYLASTLTGAVFRMTDDGKRFVRAGNVHDAANAPVGVFTYHGQNFIDGLVYLAPGQHTRDVWRSVPQVKANGDLVYSTWEKLFTEPVFEAIASGRATALFGGNELADIFSSDWMQATGSSDGDLFIQASGGPSYSANFRPQHKITRYHPNGKGGYDLVWRVGRTKLPGNPRRNDAISGGMRLEAPINGILPVIDQSLSGVFLYTEDGLYVDTLFANGDAGPVTVYTQPGEFFVGDLYANRENGKIYYASGKFTPFLYEAVGWDLTHNPVKPLELAASSVRLTVAETAEPAPEALRIRQKSGQAKFVEFRPAVNGWDGAEPLTYADGDDKVEVKCLYTPDALRFRWHVRKGTAVMPKKVFAPERLFTHDQALDTVSVYFQGDPNETATGPAEGRAGDVRFTFGVAADDAGKPYALGVGFYPKWKGPGGRPQTYQTAAGGRATYAHVGQVPGVRAGLRLDGDGKGFEIAAEIPRSAIPTECAFGAGLRTRINFDANLGGHHRFWWANTDGSANRETYDEPTEARFFPGSWGMCGFSGLGKGLLLRSWATLGPFGGPGSERFSYDPSNKEEVSAFFEKAAYAPDVKAPAVGQKFTGEALKGWWKDAARELTWQTAAPPATDVRVTLGLGAQVWYATTAVHSPTAVEVPVEFFSHPMTHCRWTVNGAAVDGLKYRDANEEGPYCQLATANVRLKAGWNVFVCRAFCVGYPPFKVGARVTGEASVLWKLQTRAFAPDGK